MTQATYLPPRAASIVSTLSATFFRNFRNLTINCYVTTCFRFASSTDHTDEGPFKTTGCNQNCEVISVSRDHYFGGGDALAYYFGSH